MYLSSLQRLASEMSHQTFTSNEIQRFHVLPGLVLTTFDGVDGLIN